MVKLGIGLVVMFFRLKNLQRFQFLNSPKRAKRGHEKKTILPPKNRAQFDHFPPFFEFQPSLFMRFSDAEIPIVACRRWNPVFRNEKWRISNKTVKSHQRSIIVLFPKVVLVVLFWNNGRKIMTCCGKIKTELIFIRQIIERIYYRTRNNLAMNWNSEKLKLFLGKLCIH